MEISPSNEAVNGTGVSQCFSTPHEPSWRRSLIECFETLKILEEAEDADCYDSDGNEPPCVKENEFNHFEASIDEISGDQI